MRRMKNFLTLSIVVFTVMFLSPSYAEGLICKITGWNCPLDFEDLVRRKAFTTRNTPLILIQGKVLAMSRGHLRMED